MDASLWSLFVSALLAATLLPGGSEAVLAYLASDAAYSSDTLLLVAALGNTLGGMTSWGIGRLIACKYPARGLVKPAQQQAVDRIQHWGSPLLLLSWVPLIGDPLCVAAGWLRIHWLMSLLFISIGKTARYAVLLYLLRYAQ
jgi:membrane protein YqaA with SNARE-associated domain